MISWRWLVVVALLAFPLGAFMAHRQYEKAVDGLKAAAVIFDAILRGEAPVQYVWIDQWFYENGEMIDE